MAAINQETITSKRMWRNLDVYVLLVSMYNSAAAMEDSLAIP